MCPPFDAGYDEDVQRPPRVLILLVAFAVAIAGTFVFALRAGRHARHLRWESEPIRPWMSVPFIAHTHHLPASILFQAIGLDPHPHDRRPLRSIARDQHRSVDVLIADLERALVTAGHTHAVPEPNRGKEP